MARYKRIDTSPRFLAVDLQRQLLPGTFEHAMNYLIDYKPFGQMEVSTILGEGYSPSRLPG